LGAHVQQEIGLGIKLGEVPQLTVQALVTSNVDQLQVRWDNVPRTVELDLIVPRDTSEVRVSGNVFLGVNEVLLSFGTIESNQLIILVIERFSVWPGVRTKAVGISDDESCYPRTLGLSKHVAEVLFHIEEPEANLSVVDEGLLIVGDGCKPFECFRINLDFTDIELLGQAVDGKFLCEDFTKISSKVALLFLNIDNFWLDLNLDNLLYLYLNNLFDRYLYNLFDFDNSLDRYLNIDDLGGFINVNDLCVIVSYRHFYIDDFGRLSHIDVDNLSVVVRNWHVHVDDLGVLLYVDDLWLTRQVHNLSSWVNDLNGLHNDVDVRKQ